MTVMTWHESLLSDRDWIPQDTTRRYTLQLTDEAGTNLTVTQVATVVLTILDLDVTPPIPIPGTWPRDVKNIPASGGVITSTGLLTLTLSPTDNALIGTTRAQQRRRWVIEWTHATGAKTQYFHVDRVVVKTS